MRTRIASIVIEQDTDGQKVIIRRAFPAEALLLMDPQVAGEGFLQIVRGLADQLDGKVPAAPAEPPPAPKAKPAPTGPPPSHDSADPGFTTKRIAKKSLAQAKV